MRIAAGLREYFTSRQFVEVETPVLTASPGNETHLHAFDTSLVTPAGTRQRRYLRTSPEFACKKLLAGGETRIFEFARCFRNREQGALHNPEFTLLEWYRADQAYEIVMQDCAGVLARAAAIAGTRRFSFRGRVADPFAAPERLSVADAFRRYAGIDLLPLLPPEPTASFAEAARKARVRLAADDTWGDIFSRILVERVEPHLGSKRATLLHEYPVVQSPLARSTARDPRLAERFELYVCGIELANGCGELTDPVEQRLRLEQQMAEKERIYGERYPIDEELLAALALMPATSGVALGFDRLVMLAVGATRMDQVLWSPTPLGGRE